MLKRILKILDEEEEVEGLVTPNPEPRQQVKLSLEPQAMGQGETKRRKTQIITQQLKKEKSGGEAIVDLKIKELARLKAKEKTPQELKRNWIIGQRRFGVQSIYKYIRQKTHDVSKDFYSMYIYIYIKDTLGIEVHFVLSSRPIG